MLSTHDDVDTIARPAKPARRGRSGSSAKFRSTKQTKMVKTVEEDSWVSVLAQIRDERDTEAFSQLFKHFAPRVKMFLIRSGASDAQAEECTQDALATVWRKAHLFHAGRASVSTWIFTIARNRRIDVIRRDRRPEPEELTWGPEPEPDQEDVVAMQQESSRLALALAELPEKQRRLIEAAYYGDLSHGEIAVKTGLPLGTIKSRIRLALERLRHELR